MTVHAETVVDELRAMVGAEYVREATIADAVDGVVPRYVVAPGNSDEMAHVLRFANDNSLHVVPRGGGTKIHWGAAPLGADFILSTKRLNRVLEHAWGDMTATVQAGCTVADLQRTLAEHGQRLPLDVLWPECATIGGILATNDSGALRQRFGSLRDAVLGVTVVLPDGTVAKSGGKVVKNVAGYDLPKLMTGAWGTLGVVTDATLRLYPQPHDTRTLSFRMPSAATANDLIGQVLDSTLVPTSLQLRTGSADQIAIDVRFEGITAALDAQAERLGQMAHAVEAQPHNAPDPWHAREAAWHDDALMCKLTFLPANVAGLLAAVERVAKPLKLQWHLVAQAIGTGLLRLNAPNDQAALAALSILRAELQRMDGSLVVLRAPVSIKERFDVWGDAGNALPSMQRVRERFDPQATLNPGRFLGL